MRHENKLNLWNETWMWATWYFVRRWRTWTQNRLKVNTFCQGQILSWAGHSRPPRLRSHVSCILYLVAPVLSSCPSKVHHLSSSHLPPPPPPPPPYSSPGKCLQLVWTWKPVSSQTSVFVTLRLQEVHDRRRGDVRRMLLDGIQTLSPNPD